MCAFREALLELFPGLLVTVDVAAEAEVVVVVVVEFVSNVARARALNASKVISPSSGGLMAKTIPIIGGLSTWRVLGNLPRLQWSAIGCLQ